MNYFNQTPMVSDMSFLNSKNLTSGLPKASDVTVVGAGIHSLIYAIHLRRREQLHGQVKTSITVLEKETVPSYKIGESTLTVFGLWLKEVGISSSLLWRLFGPKDGLAFYFLQSHGDPEDYTSFCANGPPGDVVPTLQMERKISELLLTRFAQRNGIQVLHGHAVSAEGSCLSHHGSSLKVQDVETKQQSTIQTRMTVDATGRFRRLTSKASRMKRFEGFNTNAFWAYFEEKADEKSIPLREYESCNTNHICLPEGWAWVIRLPTWEGSSIPNLVRMIDHLLDLNAQKTPADEYPSILQLVKMFDLKFRYVVSIGFALRSDVVYPENMDMYGTCEAEKKFNWIVSRYAKMEALMSQHNLVHDLYGPNTTWFVRKQLTFQSPKVTGEGWVAIGDAVGFTNPLYSPGINVNMGTSLYAAEMTEKYLSGSQELQQDLAGRYENWCKDRIPNLNRMNTFNYLCMRSPKTGPLGPLWQYLSGTGMPKWRKMKEYTLEDMIIIGTDWEWGSQHQMYIDFADQAIAILDGPADQPPSEEAIAKVNELSRKSIRDVNSKGVYKNRWAGLLRWYDDELEFKPNKTERDVLARRCFGCGNWRLLCVGVRNCPTCGYRCSMEETDPVMLKLPETTTPVLEIPVRLKVDNLKDQVIIEQVEVFNTVEIVV